MGFFADCSRIFSQVDCCESVSEETDNLRLSTTSRDTYIAAFLWNGRSNQSIKMGLEYLCKHFFTILIVERCVCLFDFNLSNKLETKSIFWFSDIDLHLFHSSRELPLSRTISLYRSTVYQKQLLLFLRNNFVYLICTREHVLIQNANFYLYLFKKRSNKIYMWIWVGRWSNNWCNKLF